MKKYFYLLIILIFQFKLSTSQVILSADGPGDTYELINSVLAPGGNVVEVPDCAHPEFGRHIDEAYDSILNENVFKI